MRQVDEALHAVIVGPVMPVWDSGRFAGALVDWLSDRGYRVTLLDSMVYSDAASIDEAVLQLTRDLRQLDGIVSVLVGYAFGGSLVVRAAERCSPATRVVALSSPTVASPSLRASLGEMCAALDRGDLLGSLEIHERYATKTPVSLPAFSEIEPSRYPEICTRMARSFRMLMSQSAHPDNTSLRPSILFVLGENSKLVGPEHLSIRDGDCVHIIAGAGMRVLSDAPTDTLASIGEYLNAA